MNRILLILLLLVNLPICKGQGIVDTLETKSENNQIPEKWNMKLFENDKKWFKDKNTEPLSSLAFPVAEYEYYVFNKLFNFKIADAHFSGISVGENTGGKVDKFIFKHEITLIFYTGNQDYQINGDVSSRNYPYLTVQGELQLNNLYDYVGVKSPEGTGYLLVNLKSFDLRFGQTVIIFPNGDNSFYYLQSSEKPLSDEKFTDFLVKIKEDKRVLEMLELANE